jgi:hypothetical protein
LLSAKTWMTGLHRHDRDGIDHESELLAVGDRPAAHRGEQLPDRG